MRLLIEKNGELFDVEMEADLEEYDLDKPLPRASLIDEIKQAIRRAKEAE